MAADQFSSFAEFWPYYVREHRHARTRLVHFLGTTAAVLILVAALVTNTWWLLIAVPVCGYGFAWTSHLLIEKNRPATFTYPRWSLLGDLKMWVFMLTGRMSHEVHEALKVEAAASE